MFITVNKLHKEQMRLERESVEDRLSSSL